MIIIKIKLNPFGGLINRSINFENGLNVIIGPNETGKSTIFNAVQKVLFTPVKLNKRDFRKEIDRYLPVGGGDTIKVEMQYCSDDEISTLRRTWGASPFAELTLPDGTIITDDVAITEKLSSLLPAREGTYRSVLMTYQSGLSKTLDDLANDSETLYSLSDIIRKSMLETDGVSIDKFRNKIDKHYSNNFSRWERDRCYPEGGRSIDNPWKRDVGIILDAFYKKEQVKKAFEEACEYEDNLDTINNQISECSQNIHEKQTYVDKNKLVVEAARNRKVLESQSKLKKLESATLAKINNNWPVVENQIEVLKEQILDIEKKAKELQDERDEAKHQEDSKELRERFNRATAKKEALDAAENKLASIKKITDKDFDLIRNIDTALRDLKTSIAAGKLSVRFIPRKDIDLSINKDLDEPFLQKLKKDESVRFEAGGRLKLEHQDWMLDVISGEGSIETVLQDHEIQKNKLLQLLEKYDVESLAIAEEVNRLFNDQEISVNNTRKNLNDELGSSTHEELAEKIQKLGTEKTTRSLETIITELSSKENSIDTKRKEVDQYKTQVTNYIEEYGSKEELLVVYANLLNGKKKIDDEVKDLVPLPSDIDDIDSFIEQYENAVEILESEKLSKTDFLLDRADLEKDMPKESAEEFEKQLSQTDEQFQYVLRKGDAIARIRDLTSELSEQMDTDTYAGLKREIESYISDLTSGRYVEVKLEDGLPEGFIRDDNQLLPYEILSTGTKDVLALALRLSMANHFLKDADGFLIMDDPFVDLDPNRQRKAAELINRFAKEKQMLIFTCHQSHADLLGGNQIVL